MTLPHSPHRVLIFIAPVLFLAIIHAAAAAPTCNDAGNSSSFRLTAVHETALEEQSATSEEMDRIASEVGAPAEVPAAPPLMLILAQAGPHVKLEHRPMSPSKTGGVLCPPLAVAGRGHDAVADHAGV